MENKIIEFYKTINIDLQFEKEIQGLRLSSLFFKIKNNKTKITAIERALSELSMFLKVKNIILKKDFENGFLIFEIEKKDFEPLLYNKINKKNNNDDIILNFGLNTQNDIVSVNMEKLPHLLVAGTTGSGKSVFINTLICQLIQNYSINDVKMLLIDTKIVEFSQYSGIPHLYDEIIANTETAKNALAELINTINLRYKILASFNCRNIKEYNKKTNRKMSKIFVFVDELADLLMQDKKHKIKNDIENNLTIEEILIRIAQIGRAAGVHLILATQRPSTNVITGLLKANIPSRLALNVAAATDSRVILDQKGAENLTGNGDMYFKSIENSQLIRLQGAYIGSNEITQIIEKSKIQNKEFLERKKIEAERKQKEEIAMLKKQEEAQKKAEKSEKTFKILKAIFIILASIICLPIGFCILLVLAACKGSK